MILFDDFSQCCQTAKLKSPSNVQRILSESLCKSYEGGPSYGLQCNSLLKYILSVYVLQAEISMIGRAYMGEVLTQVWLRNK